jgi:hypothetical protein
VGTASLAYRKQGELGRDRRRTPAVEPEDPLSHTNLSILYQQRGMIPEAEDEKARAMQLQLARGSR